MSVDLQPVHFPGANVVWEPPADWDHDEPCVGLPTKTEEGLVTSCWKVGWKGRLRFLFTGRVWLHVVGSQPPVMLSIR